jgi:hypothetical protein
MQDSAEKIMVNKRLLEICCLYLVDTDIQSKVDRATVLVFNKRQAQGLLDYTAYLS